MNPVCPWCQSEIVWDEQIGPEENCPHCFNELGDYRSINLDKNDKDDMIDYEEAVEQYLDVQEDTVQCAQCREYMVFSGVQRVEAAHFAAVRAPGIQQPFLQAPYTLKVFVCPSCFHLSHFLSEQDQLKILSLRK
jgi:Zn finger protein HypA/HybF involved in hydrogenase expression